MGVQKHHNNFCKNIAPKSFQFLQKNRQKSQTEFSRFVFFMFLGVSRGGSPKTLFKKNQDFLILAISLFWPLNYLPTTGMTGVPPRLFGAGPLKAPPPFRSGL
jgi:hypothetical protein